MVDFQLQKLTCCSRRYPCQLAEWLTVQLALERFQDLLS